MITVKGLRKKTCFSDGLTLTGMALVLILLSSCSSVISRETLRGVNRTVTFSDLIKDPDRFMGQAILLGGEIIQVHNSVEETWIEILHRPLGANDRPREEAPSGGRFMVRHEGFLDPAVYQPGKMITVAGPVEEKRIQVLGEIDYTYPVVGDQEHSLWARDRNPRFHFGIGVGARF